MQKRKRWQLFLIVAVVILTTYNILPTVFYYTKPLKQPIHQHKADGIAKGISTRVNTLEKQSIDWLHSFCRLLKIKPAKIHINEQNPQQVHLSFHTKKEAKKFRTYLPRAGNLIPFVPAQLSIGSHDEDIESTQVLVQRQIPIHLSADKTEHFFTFAEKYQNGEPTSFFQDITFDRLASLAVSIGGTSETALMQAAIMQQTNSYASIELVYSMAHNIVNFSNVFGEDSSIAKRYFAGFAQSQDRGAKNTFQSLIAAFDNTRRQISIQRSELRKAEQQNEDYLQEDIEEQRQLLDRKEKLLVQAESILKKHENQFTNPQTPLSYEWAREDIKTIFQEDPKEKLLTLGIGTKNPFINKIVLDWGNDKVFIQLHPDVLEFKEQSDSKTKEQFNQLIINEIAKISRQTDENIEAYGNDFLINLNQLTNSKSFLALNLSQIASTDAEQIKEILQASWQPKHKELSKDAFPVWDYETYINLPAEKKALGLVIYAPALNSTASVGMRNSSIYVIAKGLDRILQKYQSQPNSEEAQLVLQDFQQLQKTLKENGFMGYPGTSLPMNSTYAQDYIFEKQDYYQSLLAATREDFTVHGSKKFAILEFTNVEERLLTLNRIQTSIHEDLLKWKDEYQSAQVNINAQTKLDVPAPTQNALLSNFKLSLKKYFRGDDRKILHWGLDLSGGKTVQIELRDQNNKVVKNDADIKQGMNELYNRVNKMGVSEVNIRSIDSNIVLEFPGSQGLSAAELIKASSMFFNVVNEKFTPNNRNLSDNVNQFLQEVWNEAVVTNRKDSQSINAIAWRHLYGDTLNTDVVQPRSEAAKILYDSGLRLTSPYEASSTTIFNDTTSKIAIFRGNDFAQWQGQTHPLLIVFNNFALDGTSLQNVRGSYDPSKGNFLTFDVQGSHTTKQGQKSNPRSDLFTWTSQFSKEKIQGTPLENYSNKRGWRMAVVLNDTIISAPNLESALRDSAMISGSFSQREVNQLVADLKAGSLSFTPHILSEKNVSPELGHLERVKGIVATFVGLFLVILAMIGYYRFAGIVASVAVILNLFIMWATLQNLHATLALAGIAGIILTVGMAVDSNVLVFERIKEEFSVSGRIASAVQSGYKKAFSAILDSNITTIIAAIILLNFDAGPIKGFAITLIIGIVSSMFSALFMTRYFFSRWVQNPKHKMLKMANWIKGSSFNFLKNAKWVYILSTVIILAGAYTLTEHRHTIFGMDFTGGFSLQVELKETPQGNYRHLVEEALMKNGAKQQDFQVRELNPTNSIRIMLGEGMNTENRPFYKMPLETDKKDITYAYENNPRIVWIVQSLEKASLSISQRGLSQINNTWTATSGQISGSMRNNAIWGLSLAMLAIMIYLTIRFEFKYAASALFCLFHDVVISLGALAILHAFGAPIQIDLHTIAALMTIIGYSLNDTIIVFDRIREDIQTMRKHSFEDVINHSLNITLSRTVNTSLTTFLVLLSLVILGGNTLFNFAFVMIVGVVFGTLSSLYIASPLMLFFHKWSLKKQQQMLSNDQS